jgi:hypothetical protein
MRNLMLSRCGWISAMMAESSRQLTCERHTSAMLLPRRERYPMYGSFHVAAQLQRHVRCYGPPESFGTATSIA